MAYSDRMDKVSEQDNYSIDCSMMIFMDGYWKRSVKVNGLQCTPLLKRFSSH